MLITSISHTQRYIPHDLNTKFYSYEDLQNQMKFYLKRSNNIPMQVLGWIFPIEKRNKIKEAYVKASLPN